MRDKPVIDLVAALLSVQTWPTKANPESASCPIKMLGTIGPQAPPIKTLYSLSCRAHGAVHESGGWDQIELNVARCEIYNAQIF